MKPLSPDTHPEIERMMIEGYRKMTVQEKLEGIQALNHLLDEFILSDIKRRYPEESDREHQLRVASRRIPADLMRKAFGWDPDEKEY